MDYKLILERIDFNEKRIRDAQKELSILRELISGLIDKEGKLNEYLSKTITNEDILQSEESRIRTALAKFNGKRLETAVYLGLSERTLYRKIKQYNIT
jgi:DNA-binding NtrC family response regulator